MDDIPVEIWQEIARYAEKSTLLALRLVSRRFNAAVTPIAISALGVVIEVQVGSKFLSPPLDLIPLVFVQHINALRALIGEGDPPSEIWEGLARFSGLRRLSVGCVKVAKKQVLDIAPKLSRLMDVLVEATNGCITHLELKLTTPLELEALPDAIIGLDQLQSFTLKHCCNAKIRRMSLPCATSPTLIIQLQSIVRGNPSLRVFIYSYMCKEAHLSLHYIFPSSLPVVNLEQLRIFGPFIPAPADVKSPPLLVSKRLQCIELLHCRKSPIPNIDQLWHSLQDEGVALKELATDYISLALVEYMASFRGLQICALRLQDALDPPVTVPAFQRFISAQASTLVGLRILSSMAELPTGCDGFVFSPHTWIKPSAFLNLFALYIPCSPALEPTPNNNSLIRSFVSELPSMTVVIFEWFSAQPAETLDSAPVFNSTTNRLVTVISQHNRSRQ